MATLIKHKRVEFSELFYDLVFVFAISKATALIHPIHNGVLAWDSLLDFFISVMVIINSWMIQTIYTNRYGTNSLFNMVIMFINMGLMLFISNMIQLATMVLSYLLGCWHINPYLIFSIFGSVF